MVPRFDMVMLVHYDHHRQMGRNIWAHAIVEKKRIVIIDHPSVGLYNVKFNIV